MELNDLKTYLSGSPFTEDLPVDEELSKYMTYSILILKTFYGVDDDFFNTDEGTIVVGEEVNYLLNNNPHEDVYKMFNYLKKFTIGGAIAGEVAEITISFLSPFVKNLMKSYDFDLLQTDSGKSYYVYSIF